MQMMTASPKKQIRMVQKSKYMLFCMLQVVNPITTGPRPKNAKVILSKLSHKPAFSALLTKTVSLFSPCKKQGSRNSISPIKNPKGAKIIQPQASFLVSPAWATFRQGMIKRYIASINPNPPKCKPSCTFQFLRTSLISPRFSLSSCPSFSIDSLIISPKMKPMKYGHILTIALVWQLMVKSLDMLNSLQGSNSTDWLSRTAQPAIIEVMIRSVKSAYPRPFLVLQMMKNGAARIVRKMSASGTQNQGRQAFPLNCKLRNTNHTWYITEGQSATAVFLQSWFKGQSVKQRRKQAAIVTRTRVAHLVSNSSKKKRPISWKLLSLQSEQASLSPNANMITLKAISKLQNITPPKESNQRSDLASLAAIVCLKLNSLPAMTLKAARKKIGAMKFFLFVRWKMRQQPQQKLNSLKSYFSPLRSDIKELIGRSGSSGTFSSFFLMSSFSTGDLQESTIDHNVSTPTQIPTNTAQTTNSASVGGSLGQSQTLLFLTDSVCRAFSISCLSQTSGTQRPVKVSVVLVVFFQLTRKQLYLLPNAVCSHSYFCPGLLAVIPEYMTNGRISRRSQSILPVMIFSTNYMQSLAGAPQRHCAAIQNNNNHLIIIINLLFGQQVKTPSRPTHKQSTVRKILTSSSNLLDRQLLSLH